LIMYAISFYSKSELEMWGVYIVVGISMIVALYKSLVHLLEFKNLTYVINSDSIIINKKLFSEHRKIISISKIRSIDQKKNILTYLFGVATIKIFVGEEEEDSEGFTKKKYDYIECIPDFEVVMKTLNR
jgi:uncharacterized membrane protein YdbT with pleckstrin-like domain